MFMCYILKQLFGINPSKVAPFSHAMPSVNNISFFMLKFKCAN